MALEISFCFSGRVEISLAIQQQGKQICDKYSTKGGGIQYDYSRVIDFQWYQLSRYTTNKFIVGSVYIFILYFICIHSIIHSVK